MNENERNQFVKEVMEGANTNPQKDLLEYTENDVIQLPKNEVREGVIIGMEVKNAKEIFGDKALNPNQDILIITYEVLGLDIKGEQIVNYYPKGKVKSNSKLGQLINYYGGLKVGMKVKIDFDKDSNHKIIS